MRLALVVLLSSFLITSNGLARDDGRYAQSPLKGWFDGLKSKGGASCCSNADGFTVEDPDWDTTGGHYRVRIEGKWIDVPDDAVIDEPNRAGKTMVWPFRMGDDWTVRCFLPGVMT